MQDSVDVADNAEEVAGSTTGESSSGDGDSRPERRVQNDSSIMATQEVESNDESSSEDDESPSSEVRALHETSMMSTREVESVALLREIFPNESDEELKMLHRDRLQRSASKMRRTPPPFTSNLGRRVWNMLQRDSCTTHLRPPEVSLPEGFLRLPSRNKGHNVNTSQWQEQLMGQLEQRVQRQHREYQETREVSFPLDEDCCYSRALSRDASIGLGLSLCEDNGYIWVHSLLGQDGVRWFRPPPDAQSGGPAIQAGIDPGDLVLGIQGEALLPTNHGHFLRQTVSSIQYADNPVVLHLQRVPFNGIHPLASTGPSLLDTTIESLDTSLSGESVGKSPFQDSISIHQMHPFIETLAQQGLLHNKAEELRANSSLIQFTERTRHWESSSSFRIDTKTFKLRPHFDSRDLALPWNESASSLGYDEAASIHPYAPSTPTLNPEVDSIPIEYLGFSEGQPFDNGNLDDHDGLLGFQLNGDPHSPSRKQVSQKISYPGKRIQKSSLQLSDIFIPLMGVRKALCVRIVNTFIEEHRTAYTIWVYDVESGREWYAPVRYLSDFQELRSATAPLCRSIYHIPFPSGRWLAFGVREDSEPDSVRIAKCEQLENFLRILCALMYTHDLHPDVAEVAIHVQSFLGCDGGLAHIGGSFLHLQSPAVNNEPMCGQRLEEGHSIYQMHVRILLKRSIQRYAYRLFLLNAMKKLVDDFVSKTRACGPTLKEVEALESQGREVLKDRAMRDLGRIQRFLDHIQSIILEGCAQDFECISQRREFCALRGFMAGTKGSEYLEKIMREAVREQVEVEIYVPLRSVVSRLLVNGWRYDDMEMHFKMQELRKRPQAMFKIPKSEQSPSGWRSVSAILNDGVGRSTLPCAKLRAIVDAAKEITYVYSREHDRRPNGQGDQSNSEDVALQKSTLGADDFLPIFIYSVVRADMERPCALCVLLQTLCDQSSRIGETGYYLATFEGALTHIQELDLTLDRTRSEQ